MSRAEPIALNALPDTVFQRTVEKLTAGEKVAAVARWLMTQDRGVLSHEVFYNMRKHVAELQFRIAEHGQDSSHAARKLEPPTLTKKSACQVDPSPQDAKLRVLQDVAAIVDRDRVSARDVLQLVLIDAVDQLEFERSQQQKAGKSGEMRCKVRNEICRIGEVLGKLEHAELQMSKDAGSTEYENFGRINLPELTPAQLDLQTKAKAMSPSSRMVVNDMVTSVRQILKLDKELRETEAALANPKPPLEFPPLDGEQS